MRPVLALPLLASLSVPGCQMGEETGFVEVKRQFSQVSRGAYRLNGEDLPGLEGPGATTSVVVRKKTGQGALEFARDGQVYELCRFSLAKNRIVTLTLYLDAREIKCAVQS